MRWWFLIVTAGVVLAGCKSKNDKVPKTSSAPDAVAPGLALRPWLIGTLRGTLTSPGGELPFLIEIGSDADGRLEGVLRNGDERAPMSSVDVAGDEVTFRFDHYDARIAAKWDPATKSLSGEWTRAIPEGTSRLPFHATKGSERFLAPKGSAVPPKPGTEVAGRWRAVFGEEDGQLVTEGVFVRDGERVTGTFMTDVGDFRYLAGVYRGTELRVSTFDGAHAFLIVANVKDDRLSGEWWWADDYHATFVADRAKADEPILAGTDGVKVTSRDRTFRFSFKDVEGKVVSNTDKRFSGKPLIIDLFGSWCPNCNDAAPILVRWHREHRDKGLEVVGLSFEFVDDEVRNRKLVRKYQARHGIEFPLLLAGVSNVEAASTVLPDLSEVKAFPTTLFIGRDGKVKHIHVGFAGPATGAAHTRLINELDEIVAKLVE